MDDDIEPQGPILPRARKVVSGFAEVGLSGAEELLRRMSPEGREQARRERAAKARRQRRLALRLAMVSAGALLVWAVLAAIATPGVALAVAMAALIVATTLIVLRADPRAPGREALVQAALPDLVDEADIWLAGYQRGLPPAARQLATDIRHRLDGLRPLVARLDPRSPAAGAIHKLVSIELPDLIDGWRDVPPAARRTMLPDGRTPDDHLVNGLHLIDAELTRLRGAAGDGPLDGIAVQGRYLELKYGDDGQLPWFKVLAPESRDVDGARRRKRSESKRMDVNAHGEDTNALRAEVHFLAALVDELMRKMLAAGTLSQVEMNEVEAAVARRVGGVPRAW